MPEPTNVREWVGGFHKAHTKFYEYLSVYSKCNSAGHSRTGNVISCNKNLGQSSSWVKLCPKSVNLDSF